MKVLVLVDLHLARLWFVGLIVGGWGGRRLRRNADLLFHMGMGFHLLVGLHSGCRDIGFRGFVRIRSGLRPHGQGAHGGKQARRKDGYQFHGNLDFFHGNLDFERGGLDCCPKTADEAQSAR